MAEAKVYLFKLYLFMSNQFDDIDRDLNFSRRPYQYAM